MPTAKENKILDCVLYNGERDVLQIRLEEIGDVVDQIILVEGTCTYSGIPREIDWNPNNIRFQRFVRKIRHVVVDDFPETNDPWEREKWQRNAVLRGIPDAASDDIVIISDVSEIPRAATLCKILGYRGDWRVYGFRMALFYFFVNYRNINGPQFDITWSVAARRSELDRISPNDLRYKVRKGEEKALVYDNAGWHFNYISNESRTRTKIAAFSHHELNNPGFENSLYIDEIVRYRRDLLDRFGFECDVVDSKDLPGWLRDNQRCLPHLFYPGRKLRSQEVKEKKKLRFSMLGSRRENAPIIICPYIHAYERNEIRKKFRLDSRKGRKLPFYLWHDTDLLGPERAFERCWEQFPNRDIIIVHSDMSPMPDDYSNRWYDSLVYYRDTLSQAGMVACNLYYPCNDGAPSTVQCAGGTYTDNRIGWLHGEIGEEGVPLRLLMNVREVHWVTFGGVLIRRDVIRACGSFDSRYKWAYVMDVDYSFEARLRGFRLYQVPAFLQHETSRTTRPMIEGDGRLLDKASQNYETFRRKWGGFTEVLGKVPRIDE